jgi:hypothetical protein
MNTNTIRAFVLDTGFIINIRLQGIFRIVVYNESIIKNWEEQYIKWEK